MGFLAAPAIAQGAHESVIYGSEGGGSADARALAPALSPAARLSSRKQPELDPPASREPHVIVIDDVLCFRQVPRCLGRGSASPNSPQCSTLCNPLRSPRRSLQPRAPSFQRVLERYQDVNIGTKPSKVHDYASTPLGLGHLLDNNEFRTLPDK